MNILICMITYNRLEFTKRTIYSLLKTIDIPYYLVVVDNNSTDGTKDWLREQKDLGVIDKVIYNPENYYPGRACNIGWESGLENYPIATHLMRTDNDMKYLKEWSVKIPKYFERINNLGQLGLNYGQVKIIPPDKYFSWQPFGKSGITFQSPVTVNYSGLTIIPWPGNIGGPCVIKREVYERGIRYDETPWHDDGGDTITQNEDGLFSAEILRNGYTFGHAGEKLAYSFGDHETFRKYPEYYRKTLSQRGYLRLFPELEVYF